ncbi:MAG TPA: PLP-dependent aminotransferase family protein [Chloroflexota bacterium]|nr:PLP-dependent aminotransferase family protein [Chloroflexota bacterium]
MQTDALSEIEPLYSRIAAPLTPIQFTGTVGARFNMGGGQPDPATLPREELADLAGELLASEDGAAALSYGEAGGYAGLRQTIADKLKRWEGIDATADEVLITNGSNHALAAAVMLFINPGDVAIVEAPTFMGGLRPFRQVQARIEMVPLDEAGLDTAALERTLERLRGAGTPAKLLYTIPNFHNPAGVNLAVERRKRLAELADASNFVILEDDAYGELRFEGDHLPPLYTLARKGRVLRAATLSKILAAGLRVGYLTAPKEIVGRLSSLKLDGGHSPFTGRLADLYLRKRHDEHVALLRETYRAKRDALVRGIERGFASAPQLKPSYRLPTGGFFLWLRLPEGVDPARVAQEAGERGVAYVPGQAFFADGSGSEYVRLAWSMLSEADLETAGGLFAEAVKASAR